MLNLWINPFIDQFDKKWPEHFHPCLSPLLTYSKYTNPSVVRLSPLGMRLRVQNIGVLFTMPDKLTAYLSFLHHGKWRALINDLCFGRVCGGGGDCGGCQQLFFNTKKPVWPLPYSRLYFQCLGVPYQQLSPSGPLAPDATISLPLLFFFSEHAIWAGLCLSSIDMKCNVILRRDSFFNEQQHKLESRPV